MGIGWREKAGGIYPIGTLGCSGDLTEDREALAGQPCRSNTLAGLSWIDKGRLVFIGSIKEYKGNYVGVSRPPGTVSRPVQVRQSVG